MLYHRSIRIIKNFVYTKPFAQSYMENRNVVWLCSSVIQFQNFTNRSISALSMPRNTVLFSYFRIYRFSSFFPSRLESIFLIYYFQSYFQFSKIYVPSYYQLFSLDALFHKFTLCVYYAWNATVKCLKPFFFLAFVIIIIVRREYFISTCECVMKKKLFLKCLLLPFKY